MPFIKALPEWNNAGTKPPTSKITEGWLIGEKPVAAWWNWHLYNTYYALQELQQNAVHAEKLGAANGVATLGSDSKLTAAQLPAIGSAQITDGSITNNDLATDVKVGSLATLTTTTKASVTAAINETKAAADAKIPLTQRAAANGVATLDATTKVPIVQMPVLPTANIGDGAVTDAKLATDNKVGSLATLLTTSKGSVVLAINEVDTDLTNHIGDTTKHITAAERNLWNASQLKKLTESNGYSISISNADLNTVKDTGFYYGSTMTNGPLGYTTGWVLNHAVSANYLVQEFVVNSAPAPNNRKFWRVYFNGTWNDWLEVATTAYVQERIDAHAADTTKHISAAERNKWNDALSKTDGGTVAAPVRITGASASPLILERTGSSANVAVGLKHDGGSKYIGVGTDMKVRVADDANVSAGQPLEYEAGAQAKANTAESNAKAASVPRNDSRVNNADLNTYTTTGVFAIGTGVTNGPAGFAYGNLMVTASSTDRVTQVVYSPGQAKVYVRYATLSPLSWTAWDTLATTAAASGSAAGLMSAADFTKLAGIATGANNYVHPSTHPATMIVEDSTHRFVTDTEKANFETKTGAQTKADAARDAAISAFNNLGLGASGTNIADANAVLESGFYSVANTTTNLPAGEGYGKLLVFTRNSTNVNQHVVQIYIGLTSRKMYMRTSLDNNATWSTWIDFATSATATGSRDGLMSAADFTKLTGIATGANNYVHPTGDGNSHVPATGTTNNGKFLQAGPTANSATWQQVDWADLSGKPSTFAPSAHGHVIADVTGLQAALDGKSATTHTHADATTSASGFQSAADKTKLNGISTGANKTTNNATNGSISIDGAAITVYTHPSTHDAAMIVESATKRFVSDTEKNTWNAKASTALATASANGLMSGADFSKLAGISAGANKVTNPATNGVIAIDGTNTTVYAHPTGDGNSHVPATGTSSNGKVLKAGSGADSASWQTLGISDISGLQTQLDAPQKFKLTQDNGSGKVITQTDLNQVLAPGTYNVPAGSSLLNRPFNSTDLAILIVTGQDTTGNTVQKFINLENDWVGKTYTRVCRGGTWTAWKQELQTGDAQMFKLVDDNGMTNSISGYDLNGLTWSGFFYGNNLLNNPSGSTIYHRVWVMMSEPTSGVQIAMSNGGFMYLRHMTGGSWSAWTTAMTDRNILTGKVQITPTAANTPTGITLTFPVAFKSTPIVQVTPDSIVPGTSITGVSVSDETTTSCKIWLTATSTAKRTINYTAIDTKA